MSEPHVMVDYPHCQWVRWWNRGIAGVEPEKCSHCRNTGRVLAPASNPSSGVGTPDEVDRLRDEVRGLTDRLAGATTVVRELLAIVEPKKGKR